MRGILPLALVSLAFAPAPMPRPSPDTSVRDLKSLQGTWHRVSCTINGRTLGIGRGDITITIANRRMQYAYDGRPTTQWAFTLNGKPKPPWLDRHEIDFPANGLRRGAYRIEGDTFTLHSGSGNRPGDLSGNGDGVMVEVFKRKKP